jgi:hypothetical protein
MDTDYRSLAWWRVDDPLAGRMRGPGLPGLSAGQRRAVNRDGDVARDSSEQVAVGVVVVRLSSVDLLGP